MELQHHSPRVKLMPIQIVGSASLVTIISDQVSSSVSVRLYHTTHSSSGPISILPLRRLYIERQIQPEMLSFVSTEEVVALFNMSVPTSFHIRFSKLNFKPPSVTLTI